MLGSGTAFVATVDPEIEWRTSGIYPGIDPVYHGHEGFRTFWHDFHEMWESLSMEMGEVIAEGDRVAFSTWDDALAALAAIRRPARDGQADEARHEHRDICEPDDHLQHDEPARERLDGDHVAEAGRARVREAQDSSASKAEE